MEFNGDLMKGSTVPIVLALLGAREMYGYEIVKEVNARTGGALEWKEGSLYPCLHRLEGDGLLRSVWREAPNGRRRKYYRLTRRGRAAARHRTEEWAHFSAAVNAVLCAGATA